MSDQQMLPASHLTAYMTQMNAAWVGRNEAGSNVYRDPQGVTYVVAAHGDGTYVIVRRIGGSCAC